MNALHFLSKNFALIAGKKGRLFRKGWRDNENKKSEKLFRFHYEHSTPILSDCLYMFCGIMQPCCNMFLVLLFQMGLVSALTGEGGFRIASTRRSAEPPLAHSLRDQGKARGSAAGKMRSQVKERRPCPCSKEPFRPRSIVSIFKVPWCLGREESRAFSQAMTMPTLKSFLFAFLCLTSMPKPNIREGYWSFSSAVGGCAYGIKPYIEVLSCIRHSWLALSFLRGSFVIHMGYTGRLEADCTWCCFTTHRCRCWRWTN